MNCRFAGTPDTSARQERRVEDRRAGAAGVLETATYFCEYCAVANVRGSQARRARSRRRPVRRRRRRKRAGSMLAPERGLVQVRSRLSITCPAASVRARSTRSAFASYRVLSFVLVNGMPVCANAALRSSSAPRARRRRTRADRAGPGPPAVASKVGDSLLARDDARDFSNGVSALHDGLLKLVRNAPESSVAAAAGDHVDDAAAEAAVLGADAGRQDLHFLDPILDEERCSADRKRCR